MNQLSAEYRELEQPIVFHAIGWVENQFNETAAPEVIKAVQSRIVLDPSYIDALLGLEVRQEILVLFYFHLSQGYQLQQHPRADKNRPLRGVFALRSPQRPNAIGVTRVSLLAIDENVLSVAGLDAINDTPVLDIKPA
ncbi:MAG: tRNA (N6-threonylcarbamoyladenosine(37)-N6)-methyltransferase TrmO [Candidatus Promineifilaceae bacterium]|nr:tRNA (N6-threonylcarbamoyladenosine(37)-N6)-methyltransferase TrmO [Candidatus Promineifilaceae bacterium]